MDWRQRLQAWSVADILAGVATVVAVVSLGVSLRSCVVSEAALGEAHTQFRQERQLVLKGQFGESDAFGCSTIKVAPIVEGFQFQRGEMLLPQQIYDKPIDVAADGSVSFAGAPCNALGKYSAARMRPKAGFMSFSEGEIPIFIKSSYAVKGEAYDDISLYLLHGTISVQHDVASSPIIAFSGLSFMQRFPVDQPLSLKPLDEFLSSKHGFYFPHKAP